MQWCPAAYQEDGDLILFGTQSHGVPEMPKAAGGRMSLVLWTADQARGRWDDGIVVMLVWDGMGQSQLSNSG